MAFLKYAKAIVQKVNINGEQWHKVASKAGRDTFADRTARVAIQNYSPDKYLLTHSTIICSVDTEEPPNVKVGEVTEGLRKINRKYANYWITPDTLKGINSNQDAWERKLLLATYRTFIGAENYLEHVQVPELSKGKIIDAVARDLGDHVYVDILTATDRKHTELIKDIESGKMAAMSMGCTIQYSQCTKCGNVAVDETELCSCVKYEKGNIFIRSDGKRGVIAELCGHADDPDSVQFIEASWVENPAFKGAVTHHVLNIGEVTLADSNTVQDKIKSAYEMPRDDVDWTAFFQKTAKAEVARAIKKAFDFEEGEGEEGDAPAEELGLLDDVKNQIKDKVKQQIINDLRDELGEKKEKPRIVPEQEEHLNENMIQSSRYASFSQRYASKLGSRTKAAFAAYTLLENGKIAEYKHRIANRDIIAAMYIRDMHQESTLQKPLYKVLGDVGGVKNHKTAKHFVQACSKSLGRAPTKAELTCLLKRASALN